MRSTGLAVVALWFLLPAVAWPWGGAESTAGLKTLYVGGGYTAMSQGVACPSRVEKTDIVASSLDVLQANGIDAKPFVPRESPESPILSIQAICGAGTIVVLLKLNQTVEVIETGNQAHSPTFVDFEVVEYDTDQDLNHFYRQVRIPVARFAKLFEQFNP